MDKAGILDPDVKAPRLRARSNEEPGLLAEMSLPAAREALERAGRNASDVDAVIVACSNSSGRTPPSPSSCRRCWARAASPST